MTSKESDRIIDAIKENKPESSEGMKYADLIFKGLSTLSFALVAWVLSTVNAMQKDMVQITSDAQYMRNSLAKMEDFTREPRFTQESFDLRMSPLVASMQGLVTSIESIQKRNSEADLTIQKLKLDIDALERKK